MKKIIMACIALAACACTQRKTPQSVEVSVIADVTDHHAVQPSSGNIIREFELWEDMDKAACFRLLTITDKMTVPVRTVRLEDRQKTDKRNKEDAPLHREKVIAAFYAGIGEAIQDLTATNGTDSTLGHSECFATIAAELARMSESTAQKRELLVYSNLFENTEIFSCYRAKDKKMLETNPKAVVTLLTDTGILPQNLSGVSVRFIFNPDTRQEDKIFRQMVAIYRLILEPRNATITIQANN